MLRRDVRSGLRRVFLHESSIAFVIFTKPEKQNGKKDQKGLARFPTCTNLSVPQRKTRAERKKNEKQKQLIFPKFQNDLSENKTRQKHEVKLVSKSRENKRLNCALQAKSMQVFVKANTVNLAGF